MKSRGAFPRNYHPSDRGVLERHRDVMKEFLANHRVSIRISSRDDDESHTSTCYPRTRKRDDFMLRGKVMNCVPDFQGKKSSSFPNDFLYHLTILSGSISEYSGELATESSSRSNDEDIFYDCCLNDEAEKSALKSSLKPEQEQSEMDFALGQLVANDRNNLLPELKRSTKTGFGGCHPCSQSIIASEGLLMPHARSSSANKNTVVDHISYNDGSQEGGIIFLPVKFQTSEGYNERIPQERAWDEEAGLGAIVMSRSAKERPKFKESRSISCRSERDAVEDTLFYALKSNVARNQETYFPDSEEEEASRSRRTTLISSYFPPNDLVSGGSLQLGPSLDAWSSFTDTVYIISEQDCSADRTERISLSSCDHKVQYMFSRHGALESVIVRLRNDCRTIPPVLFTYGIGLNEHPAKVVVQFQRSLQGNSLLWDEPLADELTLTQQHPGAFVCNGTGRSKDPHVQYSADSGEVSAECPGSTLREDPSFAHAGDPGKDFTEVRCRLDKFKEMSHCRHGAKKTRTPERPRALPKVLNTAREKAIVSNEELMRREKSSDIMGVKYARDTLTEESFEISDPISPPQPIRQNASSSTIGCNNHMDFWSDFHDEPLSTTHKRLAREQVNLCFPTLNSTVPLEIYSPFHSVSGARNKSKISSFSKSPHLVPSPRCVHATPSRTVFSEPFLRTKERAEIRRQSIRGGASTPHRVPSASSCLPNVRSTFHVATGAFSPLATPAGLRAVYKAGSPPRKQLDVSVYETSIMPSDCWDKYFVSCVPTGICTNKFRAKAHRTIGPCDRCWTLTTPPARRRFTRLGRSLFIARTRGGCDPKCMMFPECDGRSIRLCRHCFHATHGGGCDV